MALNSQRSNPYVGPRTFETHERHLFFGRAREARELLSLVIAERLVLFYAQSGAGKSSLVNTQLIPGLQTEGFEVLPIGRISGGSQSVSAADNIFISNLLFSLHQKTEVPINFNKLSLSDFLDNLVITPEGQSYYQPVESSTPDEDSHSEILKPRALIIDQFEEIFTTSLPVWDKREDFFRQLRAAVEADPYLWVVLVMREDYLASLTPYVHLLPGQLRARYYMQRMEYVAALEAIRKPAALAGRPFAPNVAESLVDNLRQIRLHSQAEPQLGQFVEPVQLQVVCFQLWENLKDRPTGEITDQDLKDLGNVDTALAAFYEQVLADTVATAGVTELELRHWFETELITEAGTRNQVYRGQTLTGGLSNSTIDFLVRRFLLRAEVRTSGIWYELVHDRFIEPIRQANRRWLERQPTLQLAQRWLDAGKSDSLLLEGQALQEILATNWAALGPLVKEFLTASQVLQQQKAEAQWVEQEAHRQRELEQARKLAAAEAQARQEAETREQEQVRAASRLRWRMYGLITVGFIAVITAAAAIIFANQIFRFGVAARTNAVTAVGYATQSAR